MTHGVKTNSDPIREVYVTDPKRPSVQDLADRYDISYNTLKDISIRETWTQLRDDFHQKVADETYQRQIGLESKRRADLLDKGKLLAQKIIDRLLSTDADFTVADLNCMHRLLSFTAGDVDSRAGATQPDIGEILKKLSEKAEPAKNGDIPRIARKSA